MQYVKNEWIKMWSQKNAWIMCGLLIVLIVFVAGMNKYYDVDSSTKEARIAANEEMMAYPKEMLASEDITPEDEQYFKEEIAMAEYRIANDLPAANAMTFTEHMDLSLSLTIMVTGIFTVVIAAGIVSSEFGTGTIKMLLTRPVSRWKILLSKLVASILYGIVLFAAGIVVALIIGIALFGTDSSIALSIVDGQIVQDTVKNTFIETTLYSLGSTIMTIIFAFMIGTIFGSSTLAVSLSLFILLMGSTATMFIAQYDFAKYIWFANDLSYYAPGSMPMIEGLTFTFSLVVNIVYAVIFLAITFGYFMKRDVTA
ncbi:ABC-type transport system involved in multi-copper enzyme maturation, permease component [Solibacillus isronensis B3W22]|uniref:ABC-type transport system involved in multi-copper enzyme maturation, permease component n=1 Tax=Solibacillus isronensis B3W22 TaxID=1224748 RepID=K1KW11_9BACL|nr:ABC transporter permease [Solibacillus isronensis]AMO85268.1 ABC transporter [Solibacillus silvestris]EKB44082.1 ABC-type transport system involved in multi-copper enzyme maturation, permease component [Solibacillus isronensis B3W22]